jgi:PAS domain S-box-containing protein
MIRELSLRQRLLMLTMVTSGVAVLVGCLGFLAYDMKAARDHNEEELRSAADLIGTSCTAALAFDDSQGGTRLLEALRTRRHIRMGILYRPNGSYFASFVRDDLIRKAIPPRQPTNGMVWNDDRLVYSSPVSLDGRQLGSLYLESDLTDLQDRLQRFEQVTTIIALGSLLVVYLLTAILQQSVTKPILNLANIARLITAEKSYSLRAPPLSGRELRQLSSDFNHMLEEIERQDAALKEAREVLELRVAARTSELETEVKERRRAEEQLQQRTTFLNTLIEHSPLAIAVGGPDARFELVNPAFEKLFGYTSAEAIGGKVDELTYPAYFGSKEVENRLQQLKRESIHETTQRRRKDGKLVDVEVHAAPLKLDNGDCHVLAVYQDISERLEAQRALRESEQLFRTLSAAAPVGIFHCDAQGGVVYGNGRMVEMTGWAHEKAAGYGFLQAVHPDDREKILKSWREAAEREGIVAESFRCVTPDGRALWVDIFLRALRNERGKVAGLIGVMQDVTERHESQERLREAKEAAEAASRAKSEFLANMSHEIRTPMNGILGMTELALDTELKAVQREYLEMVKSSADALLGIIDDILDFSKIEAGRMDLETVPFSLLDCIEGSLEPLAVRAQQKGLELSWGIQGELPEILLGDPTRLRQILINLVGNAIKFTKQGEVSVQAEKLPLVAAAIPIRISVSDTGIGIPKEKHQQIFAAFSQADTSTTREFGGTGLGLSISARLIQLMGGQIEVNSEPGRESAFRLTIPFMPGIAPKDAVPATVDSDLMHKKVLVVDDSEINRHLLLHLLSQWGMEPTCAENGPEALRIFEKSLEEGAPFPIVLLDQNMPQMNGYQVAEELRGMASNEQPAIVILSSAPSVADMERARRLGIERRLVKPLRRSTLLEVIREGLRMPSSLENVPILPREMRTSPGLRLLLAEDNPVNQKLAIHLLEKMGHHVTLAVNGREAVDTFKRNTFDAILMDIQMPVMSGVEATHEIRERERASGGHIPIIAMTAHAMAGDAEKYLSAGMDGYVSKPVRTGLLRAEIDRLAGTAERVGQQQVKEAEKEMPGPFIDFGELLARVESDRELLRDLLAVFKEEFTRHSHALRSAVEARDADQVALKAHILKGMLANLAAHEAAETAAHLESLGRNGATAEFEKSLAKFEAIGKALLQEVDAGASEVLR